jgi:aspartate/methionine/tyrosine aminotransferase
MKYRPEVVDVQESPMIQIAALAGTLPDVIQLCYGESDAPTPEFICRAAYEASLAGHTGYTHTSGSEDFRAAIAAKFHALQGIECRPSQVVGTVGASAAIFVAARTCVGPGDNAVVIAPTYAIFATNVAMSGGEPRLVPLARDGQRFRLDLDRVRAAIDKNTRMLIVNSPSNPTGWVISAEEQRELVELARRHDLVILSDEVYERLSFDQPVAPSIARFDPKLEHVLVVNSLSKTYNMTGWRLGWAIGNEQLIGLITKAAEFITSNAPTPTQQAAIVALRDGEDYVRQIREEYRQRRDFVMRELNSIPGVSLPIPGGAFYAFPQIEGLRDSTALARQLVSDARVAMTPGVAFGPSGEGYIRLCFAASEKTLRPAMERFKAFMLARKGN